MNIHFDEKAVFIPTAHSKTGGARRVTLHSVALNLLKSYSSTPKEIPVCPAGWEKKWKNVRNLAGWGEDTPWPQDVLRHTFASYHAAQFRDYSNLQWEMGHSSATLLRTRYLNMEGISEKMAKKFRMAG